MAFDYEQARADAKEIIEEFGLAGTFTKDGAGSGGYDDFGNPIPAEPDIVINGIVTPLLPFGLQTLSSLTEEEKSTIKKSDGYVFFHSEDAAPIGATITMNGNVYRIKSELKSLTSVDGTNVFRSYHLTR